MFAHRFAIMGGVGYFQWWCITYIHTDASLTVLSCDDQWWWKSILRVQHRLEMCLNFNPSAWKVLEYVIGLEKEQSALKSAWKFVKVLEKVTSQGLLPSNMIELHQPRLWFIIGGYLVKRWFIPAAARARGQSNDLNREILASNLFNCHKEVINAPPVPSISRCIHIVYRHKKRMRISVVEFYL